MNNQFLICLYLEVRYSTSRIDHRGDEVSARTAYFNNWILGTDWKRWIETGRW